MTNRPLTYAEIDLTAIAHNFREIKQIANRKLINKDIDHVGIIPVIKSNAYGHGMVEVSRVLDQIGTEWIAVSNVNEAATLRRDGRTQKILILESVVPSQAQMVVEHDLTPSICTMEFAKALDDCAAQQNKTVKVHVKTDTGMSRFGIPIEEGLPFIERLQAFDHLEIEGLYTHFPMADVDSEFTQSQIKMVVDLLTELEAEQIHIPYVHAANSMGIIGYQNYAFNLARVGLMLYGNYPRADFKDAIDLRKAMEVHTQIAFVKEVKEGEGISYGYSYKAKQDMVIAILPIGYADGYFRHMSNKASVLIDGKRCPVVGRVTMDQIMVDISQIEHPQMGMDVVILGKQGNDEITADELADWAETISYEITCSLGSRLEKVYTSTECRV